MMKTFLENSYLFGANAPFIEELYESYLRDPDSINVSWRRYFDQIQKTPVMRLRLIREQTLQV